MAVGRDGRATREAESVEIGNSLYAGVKGKVKVKSNMSCLGDMEKDWDDKAQRVGRKKHWQREYHWKREVFHSL